MCFHTPYLLLFIGLLPPATRAQDPPLYRIEPFTLDNVRAHVAKGVEVKKPGSAGWIWMYRAAYDANAGIIRFLLDQGVPVNAQVGMHWTPLYALSYMSHLGLPGRDNLGCARLLIEHGADVNFVEPDENNTPLLALSYGGDPELARYLIQKGADPNVKNKYGESAMVRAIESHRLTYDLIRVLLLGGARATEPHTLRLMHHSAGVTPLHLSAYKGDAKVVSLMIQRRADLNVRNESGRTPLHVAALLDSNTEMIKLLLKSGASAKIVDKNGETAAGVAMRKKNLKVLTVFREFKDISGSR